MPNERMQQFYDLNADGAISELKLLTAELNRHGATIRDVVNIQRQANVENQSAVTTLTAINSAGQKVVVKLKQQNKETEEGVVTTKDLSSTVTDLDSRVKNLVATLNAYKGTHTKVDKVHVRTILQTKNHAEQIKLLTQYIRQLNLEEKKQIAQRNAASFAQKQIAATFITDYQSRAGTRKGSLSGTDIVALNAATTKLYEAISVARIGYTELFDLQSKLNAGQFVKISPQFAEVAQALAELNRLYKNLEYSGTGAFQTISHSAEKESRKTILAWQNYARFFATHLAYTLFFQTIQGIRAAAQETFELQKRISEIRTITQDNQRSQEEYFDSIRKIAIATGATFQDVAEGWYETVSNQIATGERASDFLINAGNFARVTNSTVEDSINLLSSAINAYSYTAEDAGEISAKLFRLIDLGRVRASELSDTFGRVAVLGSQMGVSLDEVSASLAILTINGVRYSEAYTQVNNLMQAFLKPTEKMAEFIHNLGFETGEQLIKIKGWTGVLALLRKELERGGVERIAQLDDNIRGLRGAIGLIGSSVESGEFAKTVNGISSSLDDYKKAVDRIAFESPAANLQLEWRKLQGTILTAGPAVLSSLVFMTRQINGQMLTLKKDLSLLFISPMRIPELYIRGYNESENLDSETARIDATIKRRIEQGEAYRKHINITIGDIVKRFEDLKKANADKLSENFKKLVEGLDLTKQKVDSAQAAFERMLDPAIEKANFFKETLNAITKAQQSLDKKEFDTAVENANPRGQRTILSRGIDDALARGKGALGEGDLQKAEEEFKVALERFDILANKQVEAAVAYNDAKIKLLNAEKDFDSKLRALRGQPQTRETFNEGQQLLKNREIELAELKKTLDVAKLKLLDLIGEDSLIFNSTQELTKEQISQLLNVERNQSQLELAIQDLRRRAVGQTPVTAPFSPVKYSAGVTPERLADLDALSRLNSFNLNDFKIEREGKEFFDLEKLKKELDTISGILAEPIEGDPFKGIIENAQTLIKSYLEVATAQNKVTEGVGMQELVADLDQTISKVNELKNAITSGAVEFMANLEPMELVLEKLQKEGGADAGTAAKGFENILKTLGTTTSEDMVKSQDALKAKIQEYKIALAAGLDSAEAADVFTGDAAKSFDEFTRTLETTLLNEIERQIKLGTLKTEMDRLSRILGTETGTGFTPKEKEDVQGLTTTPTIKAVKDAEARMKASAATAKVNFDALDSRIAEITGNIGINVPTASTVATEAIAALAESAQLSIGATTNSVAILAAELARLPSEKTVTIRFVQEGNIPTISQALGGVTKLASGGSALGTDFVPALLSPGEFVVNAQAAKQFHRQLSALNAGQQTVNRVSNTSFGDIKIFPSSSQKISTEFAREIALAIKREIRKGTVSI